ncbi:MAG: ImmA/IrrE family metallo-endopeptidase, partial [Candidatus Cloacimonadales bacterium]
EHIPRLIPGAFRISTSFAASELALATWLRKGELRAQEITTNKYSRAKIKNLVGEIRQLTTKEPEDFIDILIEKCADSGIVLALVPHISKTHINGATKWINSQKVILQLSLRGAYADIFWFSLFHEIGHIYYKHNTKEVLLEKLDTHSEIEIEADDFARKMLIPDKEYNCFIANNQITKANIISFCAEQNIHPGILVGRLMHEKLIKYSQFSELRDRYSFSF